jgi:hypothetical protein
MFWKKKTKPPTPEDHVTEIAARLVAMSAARKMVVTVHDQAG